MIARHTIIGACLAGIFAASLAATTAFIPPWQNPDEPQHYMKASLYATHSGTFSREWADPEAEREIVISMAQHGWWQHYGLPTPNPVPATFAEGPARVVEDYFGPTPGGGDLYYQAVAFVFRVTGADELLGRLYIMRGLSATAALLMLWMIWLGTNELFGPRAALVVTTLTALHPQIALVSTTAGPSAVVNLAGAAVWWQGARAIRGSPVALGWALAAAFAGTTVRRMAAPLVAIVVAITLLRGVRTRWLSEARSSWLMRAAAPALAVVALAAFFWRGQVIAAFDWAVLDPASAARTSLRFDGDVRKFLDMWFRTFWISAGWMRHGAPSALYVLAAAVCAISLAGLIRARVGGRGDDAIKFAVLAVATQASAAFVYFFGIAQMAPQGRYVFPVLAAFLTLIWIGWRNCFGVGRETLASMTLIAAMAVLNVAAWTLVILPAYL